MAGSGNSSSSREALPRTAVWYWSTNAYSPSDNASIEAAYQRGDRMVRIFPSGLAFQIEFDHTHGEHMQFAIEQVAPNAWNYLLAKDYIHFDATTTDKRRFQTV